ncbi:MAG: CvpA family protein [Candidatus Omnitrophota bacterium]
MPDIIQEANWIDIFFVILLLGMVYKGLQSGVGNQILSLIGYFILLFFSIGYYELVSNAIFGFLLQKWTRPVAFILIAAIVFIATKLLQRIFSIMSSEQLAPLDRIGGAVLAGVRSCLVCGIIGIFFLLTPIEPLRGSIIHGSKTGMYFVDMDIKLYSWMIESLGMNTKEDADALVNKMIASITAKQ